VLGTVYSGAATPGTVVVQDGSFTLATPHKATIDAKQAVKVRSKETLLLAGDGVMLTTKPDSGDPAASKVTIEATGTLSASSDADVSVTAKTTANVTATSGATVNGGTQLTLNADGSVSIRGGSVQITGDSSINLSAPSILLGG
jgi:hypothetical protein